MSLAPETGEGFGSGSAFFKLSGSGNDFVAFDRMSGSAGGPLPTSEQVRALCRRGLAIGADGVMILRPAAGFGYELVYYNADGSRAALCGNATLCSVRLAVELGYAGATGVRVLTDTGSVTGRIADGLPEIDLVMPTELVPDRRDLWPDGVRSADRIGFARVGVPHVVIACDDSAAVDLEAAAPYFRHHPTLHDGANVNFVSRAGDRFALRTFERGVEAETLACGTGSVATALLLAAWAPAHHGPSGPLVGPARTAGIDPTPGSAATATVSIVDSDTEIVTRSGLIHRVRTTAARASEPARVSLAGSARIVFRGELGEGDWSAAAG